jgi:hypothetical protein
MEGIVEGGRRLAREVSRERMGEGWVVKFVREGMGVVMVWERGGREGGRR